MKSSGRQIEIIGAPRILAQFGRASIGPPGPCAWRGWLRNCEALGFSVTDRGNVRSGGRNRQIAVTTVHASHRDSPRAMNSSAGYVSEALRSQ